MWKNQDIFGFKKQNKTKKIIELLCWTWSTATGDVEAMAADWG